MATASEPESQPRRQSNVPWRRPRPLANLVVAAARRLFPPLFSISVRLYRFMMRSKIIILLSHWLPTASKRVIFLCIAALLGLIGHLVLRSDTEMVPGNGSAIQSISLSPTGDLMAVVTADGRATIRELGPDLKVVRQLNFDLPVQQALLTYGIVREDGSIGHTIVAAVDAAGNLRIETARHGGDIRRPASSRDRTPAPLAASNLGPTKIGIDGYGRLVGSTDADSFDGGVFTVLLQDGTELESIPILTDEYKASRAYARERERMLQLGWPATDEDIFADVRELAASLKLARLPQNDQLSIAEPHRRSFYVGVRTLSIAVDSSNPNNVIMNGEIDRDGTFPKSEFDICTSNLLAAGNFGLIGVAVLVSQDKWICAWRSGLKAGQKSMVRFVLPQTPVSAALAGDGNLFPFMALGYADGTTELRSHPDGKLIRADRNLSGDVTAVAISRSRRFAIFGDANGNLTKISAEPSVLYRLFSAGRNWVARRLGQNEAPIDLTPFAVPLPVPKGNGSPPRAASAAEVKAKTANDGSRTAAPQENASSSKATPAPPASQNRSPTGAKTEAVIQSTPARKGDVKDQSVGQTKVDVVETGEEFSPSAVDEAVNAAGCAVEAAVGNGAACWQAVREGQQLEADVRRVLADDIASLDTLPVEGSEFLLPKRPAPRTMIWPVSGRIVTGFGEIVSFPRSDGITIAATTGTPVRAAASGVVAYVGNDLPSYGWLTLVRHLPDMVTAYACTDRPSVELGQQIRAGQTLALVPDRTSCSSEGIVFQVRLKAEAVNPLIYLQSR